MHNFQGNAMVFFKITRNINLSAQQRVNVNN